MPTLDVDLSNDDLELGGHRSFVQVIPGSEYSAEHFRSSEVLHSGNSEVQKGLMKVSADRALDAVCKLARGDLSRLKYEAKLYADPNRLLHLQGLYVPRFFGYYEGVVVMGELEVRVGCMLLEYCGVTVPRGLLCKWKMAGRVIDAMNAIHAYSGLEHGDFELGPRHVLMRGSEENDDVDIRIIDFNQAFEHTCEREMPFIWWDWQPRAGNFGCQELWNVAMMLGIWTPKLVGLVGDRYDIFRVPTVERLLKWGMHNNKFLDREYLKPRAELTLARFYGRYSGRFKYIGDPRDPKNILPLLIPEEPNDEPDTTSPADALPESTSD